MHARSRSHKLFHCKMSLPSTSAIVSRSPPTPRRHREQDQEQKAGMVTGPFVPPIVCALYYYFFFCAYREWLGPIHGPPTFTSTLPVTKHFHGTTSYSQMNFQTLFSNDVLMEASSEVSVACLADYVTLRLRPSWKEMPAAEQ